MSARSAYCQYSRFGMGSSNDAGRDSRLIEPSLSAFRNHRQIQRQSYRFATSLTPMSLSQFTSVLLLHEQTCVRSALTDHSRLVQRFRIQYSLPHKSHEHLQLALFSTASNFRKGSRGTCLICKLLDSCSAVSTEWWLAGRKGVTGHTGIVICGHVGNLVKGDGGHDEERPILQERLRAEKSCKAGGQR